MNDSRQREPRNRAATDVVGQLHATRTSTTQWRAMWALAREMWGRQTAEDLLHCFAALNFGKTSLRELSDEEVGRILDWLKRVLGSAD